MHFSVVNLSLLLIAKLILYLYLHPDISFFSSSGQTGSGKTFTMLGKSLPCLVLSNPWWEWDDSINSHVKNFHQHVHDLKKKSLNFSLSFSQGAFKLCFTKAAINVLMSHLGMQLRKSQTCFLVGQGGFFAQLFFQSYLNK